MIKTFAWTEKPENSFKDFICSPVLSYFPGNKKTELTKEHRKHIINIYNFLHRNVQTLSTCN